MSGDKYFAYAAEVMKVNPPHITDEPIVARMKRIGIEARKEFRLCEARSGGAKGARQRAGGCAGTHEMESADACQGRELLVNEHGHDGCVRELLSQTRHGHTMGLGANVPEDAIYPLNLGDETGKSLSGATNMCFTLTRASCPRSTRFGPSPSTTLRAFKSRTPQSLRRQQLDAVQIQRGRLA